MTGRVPLRAVFFDFAGTLFSDRALRDTHLAQLRFVADTIGVGGSDVELRTAYRQGMGVAFRSIAQASSYSHRELFGAAFAGMANALGGELDALTVTSAVDRQYRATIESARLRPDCLQTLEVLRDRGFHLQIVSNIDDEQLTGLLDRFALAPALDAWTSSQEAHSCKPDPGIYRLALAKAGCDADSVLFVGDSLTHDIEGPAAIGMRTAWLTADAKPGGQVSHADFEIQTLSEVPGILSRELVS